MNEAIFKSFVPGKGWIRASYLTKTDLKRAAGKGFLNRSSHRAQTKNLSKPGSYSSDPQHTNYRALHYQQRAAALKEQSSGYALHSFGANKQHVVYDSKNVTQGAEAEAMKFGGRKGGGIVQAGPNADFQTLKHEQAHLLPKRSGYRVHQQIAQHPEKLLREEARADMAGGVYYQEDHMGSGYARAAKSEFYRKELQKVGFTHMTPEAVHEYRKVQDKIHVTRQFKRDQRGKFSKSLANVDIFKHYAKR